MTIDQMANQDFERAVTRAFWRKVLTRLTGQSNDLLPFDDVRDRLAIRGQHYIGLKQVEIDKIVGSMGRYNDFDRAFLPTQNRTKARWVSIDKAHYEQISLPPVDLFKIGEIYFVKDGNHRVSVARERGQIFVDAYVTEIEIPMLLTPDIRGVDDLLLAKEQGDFMLATGLHSLRPEAQVATTVPGLYERLLEHIAVHRWYLGVQRGAEVPYAEAVASWYDNVYLPLVTVIREQGLLKSFPGSRETDLYLWIMEYQAFLRQAYAEESDGNPKAVAAEQLAGEYPQPAVRQLIGVLSRTTWLDGLILEQERATFYQETRLAEVRPGADIRLTLPGQYNRIREHITVHRWYLGEQRGQDVPYDEALASWYDYVYFPLVSTIREQGILKEFPNRTEADLYLWIIEHLWYLRETYGEAVPLEQAAGQFADDFSERPVKKVAKALRQARRKK